MYKEVKEGEGRTEEGGRLGRESTSEGKDCGTCWCI